MKYITIIFFLYHVWNPPKHSKLEWKEHEGMRSDCWQPNYKYEKIQPYPLNGEKTLSQCKTICANNPQCEAILVEKSKVERDSKAACYMIKVNNILDDCTWSGSGTYNMYQTVKVSTFGTANAARSPLILKRSRGTSTQTLKKPSRERRLFNLKRFAKRGGPQNSKRSSRRSQSLIRSYSSLDEELICWSDEDCQELFFTSLSCWENFCIGQEPERSCHNDQDCDVGSLCEEGACRQVYCEIDDDCPEGGDGPMAQHVGCVGGLCAAAASGYDSGYQQNSGHGFGYGAKPGHGSGYGTKPGHGSGYGPTPGHGSGYGPKPVDGSGYGTEPGHGSGNQPTPAPIDGRWSQWGPWGDYGFIYRRERTCTNPRPTSGGSDCAGKLWETKPKPVDGRWSSWGPWIDDGNIYKRERTCTDPRPTNGGSDCTQGSSWETRPKPVDGRWSEWGPWIDDGNIYRRERNCSNPMPRNGGSECTGGKSWETKPKSIAGRWSEWGPWIDDGNIYRRKRTCSNQMPRNGGSECSGGKSWETKPKSIAGRWSEWGPWIDNGNLYTRERTCSNPPPQNGGSQCNTGKPFQIKPKPIDGGWSAWGPWSDNGDAYIKIRTCTNPTPQNGGSPCTDGNSWETKPKSIDGGWSQWGPWSDHGNILKRKRKCNNPRPKNGGLQCIGEAFEKMPKYCTETCGQRTSYYRSCASGRLGRLPSPIGCPGGEMTCDKCKCNVKTKWGLNRLVRQGEGEVLPDGTCSCTRFCGYNKCKPDSVVIRISCCGDSSGPDQHQSAKLIGTC